ncbi:DHA2 family multidrug resistance protein-like MFS transporter [Azospirillum fermentarium]|uniref:MFS transporter n=1 Tax=Azospirillum fermentarium TaxID=1233114 RepID=UPI00222648BC|nr:MFS transporter [Azospirillum fermentarium]MCW2247808.1 DHA2 family multidrug resistance protein-like MFS transporter [Azospirillum fermentarium]
MTASHSNRWVLLVTVAAGLLLITLDNSVLYTALPTLTRELGASQTQGLWIINAYPLVMAGLLLGTGTLGDRIGHRQMFLIGLVLFGIASLVAAFSPSANILIAARAFLAVGAAAMMPATLALIRVTFLDERERNIAIAIWGSLSVVGSALGPIVGGFLLEHFWWGSVFLINVPVVIVAFLSTLVVAPKGETDHSKPWDLVSSLQALVALSALVIAIKESAHVGQSWLVPAGAFVVAVVASILFVRRQSRLTFPLLDFSIFRNAAFSSGVMAAAFAMFAIGGIELVTTQRFQLVAGFSPLEAGLLVSAAALGSLPTAMLGGAFLHKIGLRILIAGGLAAASLAVVLATWGVTHGLGWLIAGMVLSGAGVGAAMSVASTAIVGNAPVHRAGMASSVEEVSYEFGSLLAVAFLGSLLSAIYTASVMLPAGAPEAMRDSMGGALALAAQAGADGQAIIDAASQAFDRGYLTVMYVVAAVLAVGAVITAVLLRNYGPGSQSSIYSSH